MVPEEGSPYWKRNQALGIGHWAAGIKAGRGSGEMAPLTLSTKQEQTPTGAFGCSTPASTVT